MAMVAYTALGGVAAALFAGIIGFGQGEKIERGKWQDANVETLVKDIDGLSDYITKQAEEIATRASAEVDTGNKIATHTTTVIEKIVEVPVEKIIKVYDDCRVDYDIIQLRNSWARGEKFDASPEDAMQDVLPLVGASSLSDRIVGDKPDAARMGWPNP